MIHNIIYALHYIKLYQLIDQMPTAKRTKRESPTKETRTDGIRQAVAAAADVVVGPNQMWASGMMSWYDPISEKKPASALNVPFFPFGSLTKHTPEVDEAFSIFATVQSRSEYTELMAVRLVRSMDVNLTLIVSLFMTKDAQKPRG